VAICPNNNEVHIFRRHGSPTKWESVAVLNEHDQLVTSIDWAQQSNRIVTCSQDRNVYVWTQEDAQWKPTLVLIRFNRAATCVRWSPKENKIACGSGSKAVAVCYFEEENNWWVSKHIRGFTSTVLCVSWHPDNILLATGDCDGICTVFCAFLKDGRQPESGPKFGEQLYKIDAGGWVHSVAWSSSGSQLAFTAHDSTVSIVTVDGTPNSPSVQTVTIAELPMVSCAWLSDATLVASGYAPSPLIFFKANDKWSYKPIISRQQPSVMSRPQMQRSESEHIQSRFTSTKSRFKPGDEEEAESEQPADAVLTSVVPLGNDAISVTGLYGSLSVYKISSALGSLTDQVKQR